MKSSFVALLGCAMVIAFASGEVMGDGEDAPPPRRRDVSRPMPPEARKLTTILLWQLTLMSTRL